MNILRSLALGALIAFTMANADAESPHNDGRDLAALHSDLSLLAGMAALCEQGLHQAARKALEAAACRRFTQRFHETWPDRAALQDEILAISGRIERGEFACDRRCHDMVRRCEELRIAITYVFDYMDFVNEF